MLLKASEGNLVMNKERTIVTLLREIAKESDFSFRTYAYDWIKELSKNGKSMYIYGYNFPLNDTSFTQIANDKASTSEILTNNNIPNVEHFYFMSPNDIHYVRYLGVEGNWKQLLSLLEVYKKIVVKPNTGTGGVGLRIVENAEELEIAVSDTFSKTSTLCISPYYDINDEYRVIILNGEVKLVFKKTRPYIIGNGLDNIMVLAAKQGKHPDASMKFDASYIPENGEKIYVGWKHNLGQGSTPEVVSSGETYNSVTNLALKALNCLGGRFASVDCVNINGKLQVLEVNSGVMTDNFANSSSENYKIAKDIYKSAVNYYFNIH